MRQDDSWDSELTPLGVEQARAVHAQFQHLWTTTTTTTTTPAFDLVVASPLSRAIHTADLVLPPKMAPNRVCYESFREINGWLLNAKRRSKKELSCKFSSWDFSLLETEQDNQWTEEMETNEACRQRGFKGLSWLLDRPEERIFLVAHGGILRQIMAEFPEKVIMADERSSSNGRTAKDRFDNCEVRRYRIEWYTGDSSSPLTDSSKILLSEVDVSAFENESENKLESAVI